MDEKYSWVTTHKGIVKYLSTKEDSQQELIDLLKRLGIAGFADRTKAGKHDIELREIDPFTFFGYIHKHGPKRALDFLQQIAAQLNLEKPTTVNGIPSAQPQRVWLFPPEYLRVNNEVPRLWNLFNKGLNDEVDNEVFADALDIKNVGKAKLTEALFYINPEKYLPINGPTKPYIKDVLGLNYQFSTYSEYMELLDKIKETIDMPFYELSHEAWKWNNERKETATQVDEPLTKYNPIQSMIEDYKKHIAETQLKNEKYKWKLIDEYKGRPNLEAEDLSEEIKSIDYSNLIYHMSKAVINDLTEKKPEETRKLFEMLFDESVNLAKRIKDFSKGAKELYRSLGETNQHHQDERAISVYLTYKYPKKYTFYKYSFYNYYCELLNVDKAKVNERYTHYLSLINELIEQYIIPDVELIEQVKSYIPQYYDGTNHRLLAQDILFQMERRNVKENYWVFQGNPDKYDFEIAFREDDISAWTVTSHKNRIKPGDKVIIWVTGSKAGCYALAEVASKPLDRASFPESHLWRVDDTSELKAAINITHNLANNPILKDEIDGITDLEKLNVGHQGTNFTATKEEYEILLEFAMEREYETDNDDITTMNFPLNTIFYGPPGTGKTYNTVLRAAQIIEDREIKDYEDALGIFNAKLHDQIEFVTFHQNYSYEDFIQGIRPDTDNNEELTFEKRDGVFKKIADRALRNLKEWENPSAHKKTFEEAFNQFIFPLVEGEVEEIEVKMKRVSYYITAVTDKSIDFRKASGGTAHTLSIATLGRMYEAESVMDIKGLNSYYSPLLDELLRVGKDSSGRKEVVEKKNYVIIIDEINRANISRVFGELITLIEPDKRSHGEIPLVTKLPSGDKFIVPSNLYIVGTMNTADKSIALLDIALRRRFEFEAMYPLSEIEGQVIHDVEVFENLNRKIVDTKGYDFQIGHSFFMDSEKDPYQLVKRMNNKVIPLLLEYYMNDDKEVESILQSAGLEIDERGWPLRVTGKK